MEDDTVFEKKRIMDLNQDDTRLELTLLLVPPVPVRPERRPEPEYAPWAALVVAP